MSGKSSTGRFLKQTKESQQSIVKSVRDAINKNSLGPQAFSSEVAVGQETSTETQANERRVLTNSEPVINFMKHELDRLYDLISQDIQVGWAKERIKEINKILRQISRE